MSVARSYARALFEVVQGQSNGQSAQMLDGIEGELDQWIAMIAQTRMLERALTAPISSAREKENVVRELCGRMGTHPTLARFLALMARKNRITALADIRLALASLRLEAEGGVLGTVRSADPIESGELAALARAFTQKLGRKVALRAQQDSSLIAGVSVTVAGTTYDGSLATQLRKLRDQLVYS